MAIIGPPRAPTAVAHGTPTIEPTPTDPGRRPAPGSTAVLVDHVTKRFRVARHKPPVSAVADVSLRVERGEVYGIHGANGGKSTLIRLVSTLLTLDAGRIEIVGHDVERDEMAVCVSGAARYGLGDRQAERSGRWQSRRRPT